MTKKQLYISFLLLFCVNALILTLCKTLTYQNIKKKGHVIALKKSLEMWSESSYFLSQAYDFNMRSLTLEAKSIVERSALDACVLIELESFSKLNNKAELVCSEKVEIAAFPIDNTREHYTVTHHPIVIGERKLGSVSHILPNKSPIFNSALLPFIFAVFYTAAQLFAMYSMCRKNMGNPSPSERVDLQNQSECDATKALSNIKKIIQKNKKSFAVNDQILFVEYQHPYSTLHMKDGKEELIRCSLSELEHSFPITFIRINRSTLVNESHLELYSQTSCDKKKSYLVIPHGVKTRKLEISKQYETQLNLAG